jgi:hypothetical protein
MIWMTVVFMGIEIGRRAVVLLALTIVLLRRAVIRGLNSVLGIMAITLRRVNVLWGVVRVGMDIILRGRTAVLPGRDSIL